MKTAKMIFAALTMAAFTLSCIREAELPDSLTGGIEMEFSAAWAEDGDSRTLIAENGADILWSTGEEINVFYGNRYSGKFSSSNTEPQAYATFSGTLTFVTGSVEQDSEASRYWAVYPYDDKNSCDGKSITLSLAHKQTGRAGTFADKFFPAVARSSTPDLAFYNVCGGARFSVVTEGIQRIVFRSNDGSPMAGKVKIGFGDDNKPKVIEISDAKDSVVVDAPEDGFIPGNKYFAAMLPQTHEQGLTVTLYTATKKAVKSIEKSVSVGRSVFGTLDNMDAGLADWSDYEPETEGGGTRSGMYLGIIGFNQRLYKMPVTRMDVNSLSRFKNFVDGLSTMNNTLLFYSVLESMKMLSRADYPDDLFNVALVTFTDGLDQGSVRWIEDFPESDEEYLEILNNKLLSTRVADVPLTSYSVGVRGNDVVDPEEIRLFKSTLNKLAVPSSNAFEVSDMSAVNSRFQAIADQLSQTMISYSYEISLKISVKASGTRMRFTLDNASSATASNLYIEGVFNYPSCILTDVTYHGLTAGVGDTVQGEQEDDGVNVRFVFKDVVVGDGKSDNLSKSDIRHWYYVKSTGAWQRNSEFYPDSDAAMHSITKKKSAVVLLNLDCSRSLEGSFSTLQSHAKSFVQRLYDASVNPLEVLDVSLNKNEVVLLEGQNTTLKATVSPSNAENKSVVWTSSNPSVATVSETGVVTAVHAGNCTIVVTTVDGGYTASCKVYIVEEAVDLGLSVKWASCNLGASTPDAYGDYYAWGETSPKSDYSWSTYSWCMNGDDKQLTRYCTDSSYGYNGFTDNKTVLDSWDDAAAVNLGGKWRMPTETECSELLYDCTKTWTSLNGVYGWKFTSNKSGYTSKWIFLPAAGIRSGTSLKYAGSYGRYWSSFLCTSDPDCAYQVSFSSGHYGLSYSAFNRYQGQSVRPVSDIIHVSGVSLDRTSIKLYEGSSTTLTATVSPTSAENSSVTWTSSNPAIATVSSTGVVKAINAGTCTIKVTTTDGGFTASCTVTVANVPVPEAVDLGLSVKWATFNLGASTPEDYGDYFAWGETEPKKNYSWSTYKWCMNGSHSQLTKYCNYSSYGYNAFRDNKYTLESDDDVAYVLLGGGWRMPTSAELDELRENCTWIWTTINEVSGRKITSNKEGYKDKWIFLPAAGYRDVQSLHSAGSYGNYLSSSLAMGNPPSAYSVTFHSDNVFSSHSSRYCGKSVRPVCE